MAHILWIILRIILTILAVLLGLIVLVLLLLLFCPVCYRVSVVKKEEDRLRDTDAAASVQWLFHAISVTADLEHRKTSFSVRLFGMPLDKFLKRGGGRKAKAPEEIRPPEMPDEWPPEPEGDASAEEPETAAAEPEREAPAEEPETAAAEPQEEAPPEEAETASREPQKDEKPAEQVQDAVSEKDADMEKPVKKKKQRKKKSGRVSRFFRSLKKKCSAAAAKIKVLSEKAEWWTDFVTDERTGNALSCAFRELKKILRHILPRKTKGHARFGFEDPSITGRILAVCGMTLPLHKNRIVLEPVFEEKDILDMDAEFKGRIYGIRFAVSAVIILVNKDVWFVINTLKHKEE